MGTAEATKAGPGERPTEPPPTPHCSTWPGSFEPQGHFLLALLSEIVLGAGTMGDGSQHSLGYYFHLFLSEEL